MPGPAAGTALRIVLCMALVLPSAITPVLASDRDLPPYMIYIDPETGKYTTRAPDGAQDHAGEEASKPSSSDGATPDDAAAKPGVTADKGARPAPVAGAPAAADSGEAAKPGVGTVPGVFYLAGGALILMFAALALRRRNRNPSADGKSPADG